MAARRKPVPRIQTPVQDDAASQSSSQPPADPRLIRYSLSDIPTTSQSSTITTSPTIDNINNAIDQLLQQSSPGHDLGPPSHLAEGSSISRHSSAASGNTTPEHGSYASHDPPSPVEYRPYQPGQYLVPIITGETLQLEEDHQPIQAVILDPFSDTQLQMDPESPYYYDQGYRPQSTYSAYDSATSTLPAGSDLDHFNHDTEAYASGNYSRATYRIPRSRSPTPAVDEEDYHVVGNDSIHYTGYSEGHSYDIEKSSLQEEYLNPQYPVYGHTILYDPTPHTPTSIQDSLPETPLETRHFGPAPSGRVLRRHKTKKRVQLTNGNLVVDLNVPPKLILPRRGEPETVKTRYTAVTCDPDEFEKKGFFLRQNETGRRTELFIVITMYNVRHPYCYILSCLILPLGR